MEGWQIARVIIGEAYAIEPPPSVEIGRPRTAAGAAVNMPHQGTNHMVEGAVPDASAKDVLGYLDQAFFTSLRALGRQPIMYFLWLYREPLDAAAVDRFNQCLAQGFLGRVLQRSPLPWGRHRWVANPVPAAVTWYADPLAPEHLPQWRNALVVLPLDPEHGPGWRLAARPLAHGGTALALLVSHTIADVKATEEAIVNAVAGRRLEPGFPLPSRRWSPARVVADGKESLRGLPAVWGALKALARQPKAIARPASRASTPPQRRGGLTAEPVVVLPLAQVIIDHHACEARAAALGVKGNTLVAAVAVRLAYRLGRLDGAGRVDLVLPVSERQPDDWRGNALRTVTVQADPDACQRDPRTLLEGIRAALSSRDRHGDDISPILPLIPYVPLWLLRLFERKALGTRLPVTCSVIGELHPDMIRPCGEASLLHISNIEPYTAPLLERLGGGMLLACYRLGGKLFITVMAHSPGHVTTCAELLPQVKAALADMALEGDVS
ncbi:hypothetical protein [Aestuariivirga sp.]|uniref:hypothetical protein n=1 Tax=Aestuariivirga sp. TaxID=2650926 RepID=UPI003783AF6F